MMGCQASQMMGSAPACGLPQPLFKRFPAPSRHLLESPRAMTSQNVFNPVTVQAGTGVLVLDSPHSGIHYPADFGHACPLAALRVAEDTHVDTLWGFAPARGATLICARFPRTYIDANRGPEEIDLQLLSEPWPGEVVTTGKVKLGKGLVWRILDDGTPIYDRPLRANEVKARIDRCWTPYHEAVRQAIESTAERLGRVIHLNCHSMPSVAAAYSTDFPGEPHPDFVLGDRDGTTADPALTRWMADFLRGRGHTVNVNHPYKGVELVRRHGKPAQHRHSVQLEINKRLYMDEATLETNDGFPRLQATLQAFLDALIAWDAEHAPAPLG